MESNICFLGGIFPEQLQSEIIEICGYIPQTASDALEKNILDGLAVHRGRSVKIFNAFFLPSHIRGIRKIKRTQWEQDGETHINIPFVYGKGIQHFSKYRAIVREMRNFLKQHRGEKTKLIVYSAYFPFLMAVTKLKRQFDLDVCLVVADLPEYMGLQSKKRLYHRVSSKVSSYLFHRHNRSADRYVFLTEQMNDVLNPDRKPYTVVEGIANRRYVTYSDVQHAPKRLLYSGTMQNRYGIPTLLEAIQRIPDSDAEFVFYGNGEAAKAVEEAAKADARIHYYAEISRDRLFWEQQAATVLVNPRPNTDMFTKYSFPSKILEYMLSGNPVIAYKLDGVPQEYDAYLLYPQDNSVEKLAKKIETVFEMPQQQRAKIGERAKRFALEQKNYLTQTQKILDVFELNGR